MRRVIIKFIAMITLLSLLTSLFSCNKNTTPSEQDKDQTQESETGGVLDSEPPKSIKILAIGNSFSTDSMQYLYQIAKNGGVEEIVLGNLYYGGCSIDQHYNFGSQSQPKYTYHKNTTGSWESESEYLLADAVKDEEWDYISFQQSSKTSGLSDSYENLEKLVNLVRRYNKTASLIWNMTWAYQQDSTHSAFPNYNSSQSIMYTMIVNAVQKCIDSSVFDIIIPCGTSVQNARTSFLGDTLTRDGYHLDLNIGRYIAGLTWYAAITNAPIDEITFNPNPSAINDQMLEVAKESVKNAISSPYSITKSEFTSGSRPTVDAKPDPSVQLDPADFVEADTALAAGYGTDLSGYTQLKWGYLENSYWNSTSNAKTTTPGQSSSNYKKFICSDKKYDLTELPVGTVFILDSGWQYRLEIYTEADEKYTGKRNAVSSERFFVLTEEFLKGCGYVSWNISSNTKDDISDIYHQAACRLRVYLPNN